jgi:hypothetical protein
MSKLEDLIIQYETLRQKISSLKAERAELVDLCIVPDSCDDGRGGIHHFAGELCLTKAWNDMLEMNRQNGEVNSYLDSLHEVGCDHCIKSYAIKYGPLAVVRKEFGNAKRRLSYAGKKLIKAEAV